MFYCQGAACFPGSKLCSQLGVLGDSCSCGPCQPGLTSQEPPGLLSHTMCVCPLVPHALQVGHLLHCPARPSTASAHPCTAWDFACLLMERGTYQQNEGDKVIPWPGRARVAEGSSPSRGEGSFAATNTAAVGIVLRMTHAVRLTS